MPLRIMNSKRTFMFVLLGMICGGLIGFVVSFSLDSTKGWNPFGWWFIATFIMAIIGGLAGLFICSSSNKPSQLNNSESN
jgi:Ni/Fe-hydrogenase subunit HybB-like protein